MPQTQGYAIEYGPYYRTSRRAIEGERRALGQPSLTPGQIAAERYGELGAYLGEARQRREAERQFGLQERGMGLQEKQLEAQTGFAERGMQLREEEAETAATQAQWSAASTGAGVGGAVLGGIAGGIGLGAWAGPVGMVIGGLVGYLAGDK